MTPAPIGRHAPPRKGGRLPLTDQGGESLLNDFIGVADGLEFLQLGDQAVEGASVDPVLRLERPHVFWLIVASMPRKRRDD